MVLLKERTKDIFLISSHPPLIYEFYEIDASPIQPTTILPFAITISICFHIILILVFSDHTMHTIQEIAFVAEKLNSLSIKIVSVPNKPIKNSRSQPAVVKNFNSDIFSHKKMPKVGDTSLQNRGKNISTHSSIRKASKNDKDKPIIVQDLLDNVSAYLEKEVNNQNTKPKKFVIMNSKLRKELIELSKANRKRDAINAKREFYQNNRYFEYNSMGRDSTVRINGNCFVIPNGDTFSNQPKVWRSAGNCESRKPLNFNKR